MQSLQESTTLYPELVETVHTLTAHIVTVKDVKIIFSRLC